MKLVYITSPTNNQSPAVPVQVCRLVSVRECQWDPFVVEGKVNLNIACQTYAWAKAERRGSARRGS